MIQLLSDSLSEPSADSNSWSPSMLALLDLWDPLVEWHLELLDLVVMEKVSPSSSDIIGISLTGVSISAKFEIVSKTLSLEDGLP